MINTAPFLLIPLTNTTHYKMDCEDFTRRAASSLALEVSKRLQSCRRPTRFVDQPGVVVEEVMPDREKEKEYVRRVKMERGCQAGAVMSACRVNTERKEFSSLGVNHTEGGWPKDVNISDSDQKNRFRKKIEKEDDFINVTRHLVWETEKYVKQNNSINVFEEYFDSLDPATDQEAASVASVAVMKDPVTSDGSREISRVSWSPSGTQVVLGYCNTAYLAYHQRDISKTSLVYDVTNPLTPLVRICPSSALVSVQYSRKEANSLAAGCLSGDLVLVDTRLGGVPHTTVTPPGSRGDPVTDIAWLNTKTGTELLATVGDGRVIKWDVRMSSSPAELVDLNTTREAGQAKFGATGISYDPLVPYRYLVSTDLGTVMSVSLKTDSVIGEYQTGHQGTVRSVERNPVYSKIFLTTGDTTIRVGSEDVRSSSIMSSHSSLQVTAGSWSPARPGLLLSGREDGVVEVWDLLHHITSPVLRSKVSDSAITDVKLNQSGGLALVSSAAGNATLLELSDNLIEFSKEEKSLINNLFEREARRERIIATNQKEMQTCNSSPVKTIVKTEPSEDIIQLASDHYFNTIKNERDSRALKMQKMLETQEKYI